MCAQKLFGAKPRGNVQDPQPFADIAQGGILWLAVRRAVCDITASDIPAAIGCLPYRSQAEQWRITRAGKAKEESSWSRRNMEQGRLGETRIKRWWNSGGAEEMHPAEPLFARRILEAGIFVAPVADSSFFLGASPDGFLDGGNYLVEIKCRALRRDQPPDTERPEPKPYHLVQVLAQMYATNVGKALTVVYNGDRRVGLHVCHWDAETWRTAIEPELIRFLSLTEAPPRRTPEQNRILAERLDTYRMRHVQLIGHYEVPYFLDVNQ
jgi:hypothetical protein